MKQSLFITGSGGFIAGHLLRRLHAEQFERIWCLSHGHTELPSELARHENLSVIHGDLLETSTYENYLAEAETVLHLAAVTGKAGRSEYFAVNADGTATLVAKCKELGVKQFLHTSTIAVKYSNIRYYHYAQSKRLAEKIVRDSGLKYTIIRPTIVLAGDAAIWQSLRQMAAKSLIMIPGNGLAKIQPIHIDDLVTCIIHILKNRLFENKTLDLGGPDILTFESFLSRIHRINAGEDPRVVHLPLGLMRECLGLMEKFLFSYLPVTAGQISAFGNDGTADPNEVTEHHRNQMKSVEETIRLLSDE
jgi:NADH dehydrogenase